jgi:hypothetical protein
MAEKINSNELIELLKRVQPGGVETKLRNGILTSSQEIFYRKGEIYVFGNQLRDDLESQNALSIIDFEELYKNALWEIYL